MTARAESLEWVGPVIGPGVDAGVSGLAYLNGIRDGVFRAPSVGRLVSAEILEVAPGRVQLICSAVDSQCGLLGELDAALAGLLVSAAVSCVAQTMVGPRQGWSIAESRMSYIRPDSPRRGTLIATAEVLDSSPERVVVVGELAEARGRVLATVSTTVDIFAR
jgi:acyl-coenzyme A thioesterase PaaI-like protein